MATLRLRARGAALVQDHEALEQGVNRKIGRKLVELEAGVDEKPGLYGFIETGDDVCKSSASPHASLYLEDICLGALWPADEETARIAESFRKQRYPNAAPVTFDPTFGGEEPADDHDKKGI